AARPVTVNDLLTDPIANLVFGVTAAFASRSLKPYPFIRITRSPLKTASPIPGTFQRASVESISASKDLSSAGGAAAGFCAVRTPGTKIPRSHRFDIGGPGVRESPNSHSHSHSHSP